MASARARGECVLSVPRSFVVSRASSNRTSFCACPLDVRASTIAENSDLVKLNAYDGAGVVPVIERNTSVPDIKLHHTCTNNKQ